MDSLKQAIMMRRQKKADPADYMEEDPMMMMDDEDPSMDSNETSDDDLNKLTDLAPSLNPDDEQESGSMVTDSQMITAGAGQGMPDEAAAMSPEQVQRMQMLMDQGGANEDRPGLRGKAMNRIKQLISKK